MDIFEYEIKYKTPLTLDEQIELRGELLSALAKITRLEQGIKDLNDLVQSLMKEIEQKDRRWKKSNAKE